MKARKVPGVEPAGPLVENARRVVSVRVDELVKLARSAVNPSDQKALHDTRIAAKRLRYVLEMHTPVFGEQAAAMAKEARNLQDLLGEIHDCDEFMPVVESHVGRMRAEDAAAVRTRAGSRAKDLDAALVRTAPHRTHYRGLESLDVFLRARREVLFAQFLCEWRRLERVGFQDRVEEAIGL